MAKQNHTYVKPYKPLATEMPAKTRDENIPYLKSELMSDFEKVKKDYFTIQKGLFEDINKWEEQQTKKRLNQMSRGIPTFDELPPHHFDPEYWRELFKKFHHRHWTTNFYKDLAARRISINATCGPDIDQLSPFEIRPGQIITLDGSCFGPSQGKVLFEITSAGAVVELEVVEWSDTHVIASLNSLITGLRPHYGRLWLQTGAGDTSNTWPLRFQPRLSLYYGTTSNIYVDGGLFGSSVDNVALQNSVINDPDFTIIDVDRSHSGDGWSQLRHPHAGGQRFSQGYHIGVSAFGNARMSIGYRITGPKGVPLPSTIPIAVGLFEEDYV